jgi:NAD(P)-dependent dehydrogenase (short-subunit alcohol dehydrogenase family)
MTITNDLVGKRVLITGGGGLLGPWHAIAIATAGGVPILVDIDGDGLERAEEIIKENTPNRDVYYFRADITNKPALQALRLNVENEIGVVDVVVNNAAINPAMKDAGISDSGTFENYPVEDWNRELLVALTGSMLVCQVFGSAMAERNYGVIVNVASEYALIAPDQKIYSPDKKIEDVHSFKPVSYSVSKTGLIGLTRYLATYWAHRNVRCNALVPGGVQDGHSDFLIRNIEQLIPLGRMARVDDFGSALVFLCSDASSYMTGQMLIIDGGRSVW